MMHRTDYPRMTVIDELPRIPGELEGGEKNMVDVVTSFAKVTQRLEPARCISAPNLLAGLRRG
jgi:hypothetical protein